MALRAVVVGVLVGVMGLMMSIGAPPAQALTSIGLEDLSYEVCPAEYDGMVAAGSIRKATCYLITGVAVNKSGKPVLNADIFGRIYDANNDPVMQNRTRLGAIDYVPPGESDFELRISVAANQPAPLQLKQFKASGFTGKVRR